MFGKCLNALSEEEQKDDKQIWNDILKNASMQPVQKDNPNLGEIGTTYQEALVEGKEVEENHLVEDETETEGSEEEIENAESFIIEELAETEEGHTYRNSTLSHSHDSLGPDNSALQLLGNSPQCNRSGGEGSGINQ